MWVKVKRSGGQFKVLDRELTDFESFWAPDEPAGAEFGDCVVMDKSLE